jgi:LysR family tcuABC transcriptional regulator
MAAVLLEGDRGRRWRALSISDAPMRRRNYLYCLPPNHISPAASAVAAELRDTARELIASGAWSGVAPIDAAAAVDEVRTQRPAGARRANRALAM